MEIVIQKNSEELIPSFREALDSICKERKYLMFLEAPPLEEVRAFVMSLLGSGSIQYVAVEVDGKKKKVVGWCDIQILNLPGFRHTGRLGMGLVKAYRGQGFGYKLAAEVIERAKVIGLSKVELDVFATNIPAIKLYEKLGFVVEGRKEKARLLDGVYDDIIQMALFI